MPLFCSFLVACSCPNTAANFSGSCADLLPAAFKIGSLHLGAVEQFLACPRERDDAVDHYVAAMGKLERMEGVLLHQEYGELFGPVEFADRIEDLAHDQRRE